MQISLLTSLRRFQKVKFEKNQTKSIIILTEFIETWSISLYE